MKRERKTERKRSSVRCDPIITERTRKVQREYTQKVQYTNSLYRGNLQRTYGIKERRDRMERVQTENSEYTECSQRTHTVVDTERREYTETVHTQSTERDSKASTD